MRSGRSLVILTVVAQSRVAARLCSRPVVFGCGTRHTVQAYADLSIAIVALFSSVLVVMFVSLLR